MDKKGGRPKAEIWDQFTTVVRGQYKYNAQCKICLKLVSARPERMKAHYINCIKQKAFLENEIRDVPTDTVKIMRCWSQTTRAASSPRAGGAGGRPKAEIWDHYDSVMKGQYHNAQCKICRSLVSARPDRMRAHYSNCIKQNEVQDMKVFDMKTEGVSDTEGLNQTTITSPSSNPHLELAPSKAFLYLGQIIEPVSLPSTEISEPTTIIKQEPTDSNEQQIDLVSSPTQTTVKPAQQNCPLHTVKHPVRLIQTGIDNNNSRPVSPEEKETLDDLLAEFLMDADLPPSTVESDSLRNLMKTLRPEYELPTKEEIKFRLAVLSK